MRSPGFRYRRLRTGNIQHWWSIKMAASIVAAIITPAVSHKSELIRRVKLDAVRPFDFRTAASPGSRAPRDLSENWERTELRQFPPARRETNCDWRRTRRRR